MTEQEEEQQEVENKRIRPRERARGQKLKQRIYLFIDTKNPTGKNRVNCILFQCPGFRLFEYLF